MSTPKWAASVRSERPDVELSGDMASVCPFTLAELARAVGVSVQDAHKYRDLGLLQPPRRRRGRSADVAFHQEHFERLCFIKRAVGYGFSLEEIAQLVDPGALVTCADVYRLSSRRAEELRAAAPGSAEVVALDRMIAECTQTGSRRDCRILSAMRPDSNAGAPAGSIRSTDRRPRIPSRSQKNWRAKP
jgi:DNA-binding transcriptional MerR regulator